MPAQTYSPTPKGPEKGNTCGPPQLPPTFTEDIKKACVIVTPLCNPIAQSEGKSLSITLEDPKVVDCEGINREPCPYSGPPSLVI